MLLLLVRDGEKVSSCRFSTSLGHTHIKQNEGCWSLFFAFNGIHLHMSENSRVRSAACFRSRTGVSRSSSPLE